MVIAYQLLEKRDCLNRDGLFLFSLDFGLEVFLSFGRGDLISACDEV